MTAVLTGDLVKSTQAGAEAVEAAFACLRRASDDIAGWGSGGDPRLTRFRGDGWQILLADAALALRASLYLLARLRESNAAVGTRIAIGIGRISHVGTADLSDARGSAFEASGRALDAMPRYKFLAIAGEGLTALHPVVVDLVAAHALRWSVQQAEAAALHLQPDNPTLQDIGAELGITPQAVNQRLKAGALQTIRAALRGWEEAFGRWEHTGSWTL